MLNRLIFVSLILPLTILAIFSISIPQRAAAEEQEPFRPLHFELGDWDLELNGFLRVGYEQHFPATRNTKKLSTPVSGFKLYNARLQMEIAYNDFVFTSTALDMNAGINHKGDKQFSINPADITIELAFFEALQLRIGHYKPPFDFESMQSENIQHFISDSIASAGYYSPDSQKPERIDAFSPGRRLGLSLLSDLIDFNNVGLNYHVALTQANSIKLDQKIKTALALFARFEFHLLNKLIGVENNDPFLTFGAAAGFWRETVQELSAQNSYIPKDVPTWAIEFAIDLKIKSFYAHTAAKYKHFEHKDYDEGLFSFFLALAYRIPIRHYRFEFAYRFATNPTANSGYLAFENTASIAYYLEDAPLN
ncbi:MAG: hypothetical protein WC966_04940, partial [Bradymonadales bacterium]